jgi:hypothetical protein
MKGTSVIAEDEDVMVPWLLRVDRDPKPSYTESPEVHPNVPYTMPNVP